MYKNDRLIALAGVVVLIIASIGVITWQAEDVGEKMASIHQFFNVASVMENEPMAITVCDSSPFYALIEIIFLWGAILITIIHFYKINKVSAYLLIPYILWVSFAAVLNFAIFLLN